MESPSTDEGQVEVTLIRGAGETGPAAWVSVAVIPVSQVQADVLVSTPVQVSTQASGMIVISAFDIRSASVLGRDTAIIVFSYQGATPTLSSSIALPCPGNQSRAAAVFLHCFTST